MAELFLDKKIQNQCENSIFITGSARSGTTIFGKIIHSLENVEYFYEPPILYSLFPLLKSIGENDWKLLFETTLYEQLFIDSLAGRSINTNLNDDSSVYLVKTKEEIESRLNSDKRKKELEIIAKNYTIAYKVHSIMPFVPDLQRFYKNLNITIILRDPVYIINSIIKKEWFNDYNLINTNENWPNYFHKGMKVPFWVSEDDIDWFYTMPPQDRSVYYILRMYEPIPEIKSPYIIHYNELLNNTEKVISKFADKWDLKFGEKSKELIDSVKFPIKERDLNIISKIDTSLKKRLSIISDKLNILS